MQKTVYRVKKVEVVDFKPKEGSSLLKITFTKNDKQEQFTKEFALKNPIEIVNRILIDIKAKDRMIVEDTDDVLQNIYITRIENEEEAEEKAVEEPKAPESPVIAEKQWPAWIYLFLIAVIAVIAAAFLFSAKRRKHRSYRR